MNTIAITFRIEDDSTCDVRRESLLKAIHLEYPELKCWEETTSFVLLRSSKSAEAIASSIYLGSDISASKDTLLVINCSNNTYAVKGKVNYPNTLAGFFSPGSNALAGMFTVGQNGLLT